MALKPGMAIRDIAVDKVFIGSYQLAHEDLRRGLRGCCRWTEAGTVHGMVNLPGSRHV